MMISYVRRLLLFLLLSHVLYFSDATSDSRASCVLSNSKFNTLARDGDVTLGAVMTLYSFPLLRKYTFTKPPVFPPCLGITLRYYRHFLAILFAIQEINESHVLLPNITMGLEIYDSCAYESRALESTMKLLTGDQNTIPNYQCKRKGSLVGIIGHMASSPTKTMAKLTGVYRYPQVSYGAQDLDLKDRRVFPSLFQTVPNEYSQYGGFLQLLNHFGWTWVGIVTNDDVSNFQASQDFRNYLLQNEICVAFFEIISNSFYASYTRTVTTIQKSSANVVLFFCTSDTFLNVMYSVEARNLPGRVWILPATLSIVAQETYLNTVHGSLMFTIQKGEIPGFKEFIDRANPTSIADDVFTASVWRDAFLCLPANETTFRTLLGSTGNCTGKETFAKYQSVFDVKNFRLTYAVYRAAYAIAHGLHNWLITSNSDSRPDYKSYFQKAFQASKLNKYLRSIHFNTSNGENFFFDNRESPGKYDILNWIITPNKTIETVHVGTYMKSAPPGRQLIINEGLIQWNTKFKEVPHSVCSNSCLPGYRKVQRKAEQKCCYDCVMCSEGEITNNTDMTNCLKCSEYQWSNEKRDKCISRSIDFLSYEDPLGISLCFFAVQLSLLTLGVFAIFFKHKDTPIVKANNRDLSYILLLSLTLSFLCALLFIGRPDTVTCLFQQAAFGIVFTIAISSVLAKTVTVLVAFNSVKPGSKTRKWMSSQVSMYLVCICSFGEIVICFVGFLYSPPFPDYDTRERSLRMTLHCNQGYAMTFYVAVGYMTLLAVLSFVIAFLARKLPDNFNEASHITFSMLVFCSVWLSFFPAYLSTKGKYMTAVEIFAMLASSTGLLTCIFLPKCYIIILRPDLNTKQSITGKKEKFSNYSIEVK